MASFMMPQLVQPTNLALRLDNPLHIRPDKAQAVYSGQAAASATAIGTTGGDFDSVLRALDGVSDKQKAQEDLAQLAITDPSSVDAHDLTIAQAQAQMSLSIAATVLHRIVDSWKQITNMQ
jgi:flagellar hook-basal body complex protein FliE